MRIACFVAGSAAMVLACAFAPRSNADGVGRAPAEEIARALASVPDGGAPVAGPYAAPPGTTYGAPYSSPYGPGPYGPAPYPPPYGGPGPYGGPAPWEGPVDPCCLPCPRWTFTIGAWVWGVDGTFGDDGREIQADSNWTDTLENFDLVEFALDSRARVEWNRWTATFQVDGATLEDSADFHDGAIDVDAEISFWTFQGDVGYKFAGGFLGCGPCAPYVCVEGYAGLRFYGVDLDIESTASTAPNGVSSSATWVDPLVGFRAHLQAGPSWAFGLEGDIGGFGMGSDLSWSVTAFATWFFAPTVGLSLGWRVLDVDYDDDDFVFDAQFSGPFAALVFRF